MHIKHTIVKWSLAASTFALALGGAAHHVARADSSVDCSSLSRWNSDHSYKKGDQVWYPDGPMHANKQECILDKCYSVFDHNEPGAFSKAWKNLGECSSRPS